MFLNIVKFKNKLFHCATDARFSLFPAGVERPPLHFTSFLNLFLKKINTNVHVIQLHYSSCLLLVEILMSQPRLFILPKNK